MKFYDRQFPRFLAVGAANTVLGYGVYAALNTVLDYRAAYTAAYVFGIVVSYVLNSLLVFRARLRWRSFAAFPAVYALQYVLGIALLWLLVRVMGLHELLAPLVVIPVTIPITFLATRYLLKERADA